MSRTSLGSKSTDPQVHNPLHCSKSVDLQTHNPDDDNYQGFLLHHCNRFWCHCVSRGGVDLLEDRRVRHVLFFHNNHTTDLAFVTNNCIRYEASRIVDIRSPCRYWYQKIGICSALEHKALAHFRSLRPNRYSDDFPKDLWLVCYDQR